MSTDCVDLFLSIYMTPHCSEVVNKNTNIYMINSRSLIKYTNNHRNYCSEIETTNRLIDICLQSVKMFL